MHGDISPDVCAQLARHINIERMKNGVQTSPDVRESTEFYWFADA